MSLVFLHDVYFMVCLRVLFLDWGMIIMRKVTLMIFVLLVTKNAVGYESISVSEIVRVVDGDTFKVNINAYPDIIGKNLSIRIAGINTPELKDKSACVRRVARKAKAYTKRLLFSANKVELVNVKRGKYFRIVATVLVDGADLGELLISEGLAKRYGKGRKLKWKASGFLSFFSFGC